MQLPSFRLIKQISLCLLLLTSQEAYSFDLSFKNININKISTSLTYNNLIKKIPTLFVFKKKESNNMIDTFKNEYLTFYSNKNEKLRATYSSGAYYIKYTSRW